ncbi:hypothetical protein PACTADRAFT_51897 [Pachysolen tannophilus NRRL Y-2460]|uniref:Ribosomal RNA-processing protein 7 C-terminal domain-containing protein n=1 Tax=Pachysolen tannophilus NRRL Y-2460 TaxID=669874 RepID=A0A1E4TNE5_PACTA|nr:hypothetical protein PACTADRAFT_51897 [Pachysolen tannophilus NRRL Y-2460]
MSQVQEIKGFLVLPVRLEPTVVQQKLKYNNEGAIYHYIYLKKHSVKRDLKSMEKDDERSLFIANLPINTDLKTIKLFFGMIATGAIVEKFEQNDFNTFDIDINLTKLTSEMNEKTEVSNSDYSYIPFGCGIVTFLDKNGLNLALQSIKKLIKKGNDNLPIWEFNKELTGLEYLKKKILSQEYLDENELSEKVAKDMHNFNLKEQQSLDELNEMKDIVDEDGFTLVVSSHRKTKNGIFGKLKSSAQAEKHEIINLKQKKKEKQDFYRFQLRERKKQEMNDLLAKFKEDQEKVKIMKEKRRFKPY